MIRFTCGHCGQSLKMQDAAAGAMGVRNLLGAMDEARRGPGR